VTEFSPKFPDKKSPVNKNQDPVDEFVVEQAPISAHQLLNDRRGIPLTSANILQLQRTIGNRAVIQLINRTNQHSLAHSQNTIQRIPPDEKDVKRGKFNEDIQFSQENNFVIGVEELPSFAPIEAYLSFKPDSFKWRLYDPQDRLVTKESSANNVFQLYDEYVMNEFPDFFSSQGYGQYTLRCIPQHKDQPIYYVDLEFSILGPGPGAKETVKKMPDEDDIHLGSHWTSTYFDSIFLKYGLRESGNDARFGEGLYTTTDEEIGLMAGFSVVERKGGEIREWRVYGRAQEKLQSISSEEMKSGSNWQSTPWRENPNVSEYVTNYDIIVNSKEKEVKFNPRSFGKIYVVPGQKINPLDKMKEIQLLQQKYVMSGMKKKSIF
jgi:hypothetical protein